MSTNFYIRRVKPFEVRDEYHICKRSAGWRIRFQDSDDNGEFVGDDPRPDSPSFHSVADIRNLLASDEWQIADEHGETWPPGEESLRKLEELCAWEPGGRSSTISGYADPEGYDFDRVWFR